MSKSRDKTAYVCTACGHRAPRWMGKCPGCGEWNTLEESRAGPSSRSSGTRDKKSGRAANLPPRLADVAPDDARRIPTGIGELDRALGGGPVAGGVVLLGGDPGIGKSTLLMQALAALTRQGHEALYCTGEESAAQVALRAERVGGPDVRDVRILASTSLEEVESAARQVKPDVLVIDSIQTLRANEISSAMGSVTQLREVTARLVDLAKRDHVALFLIGHVTKEGVIAGPKVLEHLVDTVLAFEGDQAHAFRLVRATKNRFGPAHEVGVFEMVREGLREVPDPSALFLAERQANAAGSLVVATCEGTRPVLVEVQALVAAAAHGSARRVASGLDPNRLAILLAVLDRKCGIHVLDQDVFAQIAGGVRVDERALDLPLAVSIISSFRDRPVPVDLVAFGEVGLSGEIRGVPRINARVNEAKKLGFRRVLLPRVNADSLTDDEREGVTILPVRTLEQALDVVLDDR